MNIDPLTLQEQYDIMVTHLSNMKKRAGSEDTNGGFRCSYLDPNQNRCAVGALIPDGHPGLNFDKNVSILIMRYPDLSPRIDVRLGEEMQRIHDNKYNWGPTGLKSHIVNPLLKHLALEVFNLTPRSI